MPSAHQLHVVRHVIAAWLTVGAVAYVALTIPEFSAVRTMPLHFVWAYVFAVELLWLPLLIGIRANQRFMNDAQIDGQAPPPDSRSAIDARVLQNTLEQIVFAALATGLLTLSQAHHASMLLVAHAALFTVGRGLFWYGYRHRPTARGYGFGLSFYSSLGIYVYAASFLLRAIILN